MIQRLRFLFCQIALKLWGVKNICTFKQFILILEVHLVIHQTLRPLLNFIIKSTWSANFFYYRYLYWGLFNQWGCPRAYIHWFDFNNALEFFLICHCYGREIIIASTISKRKPIYWFSGYFERSVKFTKWINLRRRTHISHLWLWKCIFSTYSEILLNSSRFNFETIFFG